jgi:hypothetical protein
LDWDVNSRLILNYRIHKSRKFLADDLLCLKPKVDVEDLLTLITFVSDENSKKSKVNSAMMSRVLHVYKNVKYLIYPLSGYPSVELSSTPDHAFTTFFIALGKTATSNLAQEQLQEILLFCLVNDVKKEDSTVLNAWTSTYDKEPISHARLLAHLVRARTKRTLSSDSSKMWTALKASAKFKSSLVFMKNHSHKLSPKNDFIKKAHRESQIYLNVRTHINLTF